MQERFWQTPPSMYFGCIMGGRQHASNKQPLYNFYSGLFGIMNHELHNDQHRAAVANILHALKEHKLQVGCTCFWCQTHMTELLKGALTSWYIAFLTVQFINYSRQQQQQRERAVIVTCFWWFCTDGSQEDVNRLSEQLGKELANIRVWLFDRNIFN